VQADLAGAGGDREVPDVQTRAFPGPRAGVQQHGDDRGVAGAAPGGRAADRALLLGSERGGPAGPGDAGPLDGDAQPGLLVHQRDRGQRLVDRRRARPGGDQVPPPGGDGALCADQVGERVAVGAGLPGQPGDIRGGLPLVCLDGAG
jgi:hypothetical protein